MFGIFILFLAAFICGDLLIRTAIEKKKQKRIREERERALATTISLSFSEAKSLKRVEVKDPRAIILAVDDEDVILETFRKILVLDGYCVDTVSAGSEALTLVKENNYDFVFTDLKMPGMDGVEVTKAVNHLRPDIDIVIITGYATIESAVETMKYGAVEYVQKPFTDEELTETVRKLVVRREERIARRTRPVICLGDLKGKAVGGYEVSVLPGLFVSNAHVWASLEPSGLVRVGLDGFVLQLAGALTEIKTGKDGTDVSRGGALATLVRGEHKADIPSPFSGSIRSINKVLSANPNPARLSSYDSAWICTIAPTDLSNDIRRMKIGADAVNWYEAEIDAFMSLFREAEKKQGDTFPLFAKRFLAAE